MKLGKFNIVIGGQAGSEAKGKLSGYLVERYHPDICFMTSSPNAGHTIVLDGNKYVSYHLPIGAIMSGDCPILLGPASIINPVTLLDEIAKLGIDPERIMLDSRAAVVVPTHKATERTSGLEKIGSTLQGVGPCRMEKMSRIGNTITVLDRYIDGLLGTRLRIGDVTHRVNTALRNGATVLCETTQGFDLCLEHGIHPVYCTSKMINPAMALAEAGVPVSLVGDIYGVIRPYPIRVNNRTGTSGPYAGAREITWEEIGKRCGCPHKLEELTTTTRLPRRVFEFSWPRFAAFIRTCAPTVLCLQFANYLDWSIYGKTGDSGEITEPVWNFIRQLEGTGGNVRVEYVGTGPEQKHMINVNGL